jgi:hypothetical protein
MGSVVLLGILKDIVVPELSSFIHDHFAKTGELPTQEEMQQQLDTIAARIIMKGEALTEQIYKDHPELKPTV